MISGHPSAISQCPRLSQVTTWFLFHFKASLTAELGRMKNHIWAMGRDLGTACLSGVGVSPYQALFCLPDPQDSFVKEVSQLGL